MSKEKQEVKIRDKKKKEKRRLTCYFKSQIKAKKKSRLKKRNARLKVISK
jgi:hypothetical protein